MTGRAAPCTCRIHGNVNVKSKLSVRSRGESAFDRFPRPAVVGVDLGRHIDVETIGDGFCRVEPCSTGFMGSEPFGNAEGL